MKTHILDNGLRIVVQPRPFPLAALTWWVDAGSIDERPGEHGAAHFLEHMLFKGTQRRGVGEAPAIIEGLGGDLNAYTSLEQTVLYATVESSGWKTGLDVLADMARHSLIDPAETERERSIVLEEIRGAQSDPEEALYRALQSAAYPGHAYARPILGTAEEIQRIPRDALLAFWRREWSPGRTFLSIAGDIDPDEVIAEATRLLGDWSPGPPRQPIAVPVTPGPGPHLRRVHGGARQTRQAEILWRTAAETHADHLALDMLALALGDGPGGAVPDRLTDQDILLADPAGGATAYRQGGVLSLAFVPDSDDADAQVEAVVETLHEVLHEGLDDDLVERVKSGMIADHVFEGETLSGAAWRAAQGWATYGDPDHATGVLQQTRAITAERLGSVARTYLTPDRMVVGLLAPSGAQTPTPDPLYDAVHRARARARPDPHAPIARTLKNGVRVRILPDEGPVIGLSMQAVGGRLTEPARRAGLATAWAQLVTAGADGKSAGAFSTEVDRTGGELWGSSGRSTLGLHGRFPGGMGTDGIRLALSAIASPEFDETAWGRTREEMLHDAESAADFASWVSGVALWGRIWSRHPWARPGVGTRGSVRSLNPEVISDYHDDHITGDNLVVAITGPVVSSRTFRLVEEWLEDLPARNRLVLPDPVPAPTRSGTLQRTAPGEQAHIEIGTRGLGIDDPDTPAAELLSTLLGAQGGRFFLDLRERRHLAYEVWAEHVTAVGGGLFQCGLACDPARIEEASIALHAALDEAIRVPPTAEELQRAARTLRGSRISALQRATFRARRLAASTLLDLDPDPMARVAMWSRVTPAHVTAVARRLLGGPRTSVIVRPEA